jgi:hypothetical protein
MTGRSVDTGFSARVENGVRRGVYFAVVLSVMATLAYAIAGREGFAAYGTTYPETIAAYWLGCLTAGAIAGALQSVVTSHLRAALVGIAAAVPFAGALTLTVTPFPPWTTKHTITVIGTALCGGGPIGVVFYVQARRKRSAKPRS